MEAVEGETHSGLNALICMLRAELNIIGNKAEGADSRTPCAVNPEQQPQLGSPLCQGMPLFYKVCPSTARGVDWVEHPGGQQGPHERWSAATRINAGCCREVLQKHAAVGTREGVRMNINNNQPGLAQRDAEAVPCREHLDMPLLVMLVMFLQ